jgi:redox-sensitive bicupin YhaK (pirin superfamily)
MDIELARSEPSVDSCTALKNKAETRINEKMVRVYKFDLGHQETFNLPAGSCAHLLICTAGETNSAGKKIKTGNYVFFNPGTQVSLNNTKPGNATCILLELK